MLHGGHKFENDEARGFWQRGLIPKRLNRFSCDCNRLGHFADVDRSDHAG